MAASERENDEQPQRPSIAREGTVLFALELGGGWGHIGVIQPLVRYLVGRGRRVVVVTPQLGAAARLLDGLDVTLLAAPATSYARRTAPIRTFAQVMTSTTFSDATTLSATAASWQAIFACARPEVIACDHAPTALLVARTTAARRFVIGQGFTIPDAVSPLTDWRPRLGSSDSLLRDELQLLDRINGWLAQQECPALSRVADLYHDVDGQILATLPELDPCAPRVAATPYAGVWSAQAGAPPVWPAQPGKRVLAYLKPFGGLATLLEQLRRLSAASLVVCPGIDEALAKDCDGTRVRIERSPLDLNQAAQECDLAIGHGTHGFTTSVLLAGKPQLMIPLVLEQRLTTLKVEQLGAGLAADQRQPRDVILKLRRLWESPAFASAAQTYAAKYAHQASDTERIAAAAERLIEATA